MGSLVGPILANVFMMEIANTVVPRLNEHVKKGDTMYMTPLLMLKMNQLTTS